MNANQKTIFYLEIILILILLVGYLYDALTFNFVGAILLIYVACFGAWYYFKSSYNTKQLWYNFLSKEISIFLDDNLKSKSDFDLTSIKSNTDL